MKTAIFIDAGYLIKLLKIKGRKIDFLKLSNELTSGTERVMTFFYDTLPLQGTPKGNMLYARDQRFHHALNSLDKFQVKSEKNSLASELQKIKEELASASIELQKSV